MISEIGEGIGFLGERIENLWREERLWRFALHFLKSDSQVTQQFTDVLLSGQQRLAFDLKRCTVDHLRRESEPLFECMDDLARFGIELIPVMLQKLRDESVFLNNRA